VRDMEALTHLAERLVTAAKEQQISFVTAESCTAGALATLLAEIPGAGDTFFGGFVSYSKAFKEKILRVPTGLIEKETAVSDPVARAMAKGALEQSGCDLALAITGVLGPKPDEDGNPVGLFFVAAVMRGGNENSTMHNLGAETPGKICGAALREALSLGLREIRGAGQ
jgi:nicotinamide-nucleotide amidase